MHSLIFVFLLSSEAGPRVEETIVVTGERLEQRISETAAAVTVLNRNTLESHAAITVADALRFVPGLQVISVDGIGTPMISTRGFFGAGEVEYVQSLVDGAPANDVESGNGDWRSIGVDSIDHIEVLRGAGSSIFGDVALAGVVQVFRDPHTNVSLSYGSFDSLRGSATVATDRYHAAISAASMSGFRDHSDGREFNGSAGWRAGRVTINLDVAQRMRKEPGPRSAAELEDDPFGSDPLFRFDRDDTRRVRLSARAGPVTVFANDRKSETVRTLLLAPGFGDRATRWLDSSGAGLSAADEWDVDPRIRLGAGADVSRDILDTRYEGSDRSTGNRLRTAAFITGEWRPADRLRLAAGARWDRIADDFDESQVDEAVSPRLAAMYEFRPALTAWIQIARAFKAPTLEQRFDPRPFPDFTGGTFTISNGELRPQTATTIEAGARGRWWEFVAYDMRVQDEIDFDVATFRYENIGRSRHRGIELAARTSPRFRVQPAITYAWTRVEPLEGPHRGRQLKNIAEHLVRGNLHLTTPVAITLSVEHTRGRFLDDANEFPLGRATLVDLALTQAFGVVRATLHARNLFDQRYAPLGFSLGEPFYFPGAGRSIGVIVSWRPDNGGPS